MGSAIASAVAPDRVKDSEAVTTQRLGRKFHTAGGQERTRRVDEWLRLFRKKGPQPKAPQRQVIAGAPANDVVKAEVIRLKRTKCRV